MMKARLNNMKLKQQIIPAFAPWHKTPGLHFMLAGLAIFYFAGIRSVLYVWGIPLPMRLIAQFSGAVGAVLFSYGAYSYIGAYKVLRLMTKSHQSIILLWYVCLLLFFVVGVLNGNSLTVIGKEFIILWLFGLFWTLGADDRFWFLIAKPLTIIFYITVPLIMLYASTPGLVIDTYGTEQLADEVIGRRNINTIGYGLRPVMGSGLFLFVWGVLNPRKGIWRNLQIGAFPLSLAISVGLFVFRGAAFTHALVALIVLLIRPRLEKRKRPGISALLVLGGILGAIYFAQTDAFAFLLTRTFEHTRSEPIFASRLNELSAYFSVMRWEVFTGRGLGGHFDASSAFDLDRFSEWSTLHFGIFVFTLKGGVLLAGLFLAVLMAGFRIYPQHWYQDPMNLTATLLFPLLVFSFSMNPFHLTPEAIFQYLPVMMALGRFGRRTLISDIRVISTDGNTKRYEMS